MVVVQPPDHLLVGLVRLGCHYFVSNVGNKHLDAANLRSTTVTCILKKVVQFLLAVR